MTVTGYFVSNAEKFNVISLKGNGKVEGSIWTLSLKSGNLIYDYFESHVVWWIIKKQDMAKQNHNHIFF